MAEPLPTLAEICLYHGRERQIKAKRLDVVDRIPQEEVTEKGQNDFGSSVAVLLF